MKDLDFDELDKAVNSLMGGVPDAPEATKILDTTSENVLTINTSTPPAAAVVSPPPTATPLAAKRSSGRFMDVVHPSSNMKSRPPAVAPSGRVGVTIMPRTETLQPTAPTPAQTAPKPVDEEQSWPDPLDLMATNNAATPENSNEIREQTAPVAPVALKPEVEATSPDDASSGSPFLSDTKVEKRPLGSEPPTGTDAPLEDMLHSDAEPFVQEKIVDGPPSQPIPAELNSDLVAIESSELSPRQTEKLTNDQSSVSTPLDHRLSDHVASAPTGPTSIAQQYKEQQSSGDQSHAAIYDTAGYGEPLAHPAKKKAGWLWIVWVLLLLAVGAGGAVALYLAHII